MGSLLFDDLVPQVGGAGSTQGMHEVGQERIAARRG